MKQVLILLLFLTGVAPLVQYKYYLIQQGKTWSDAQTYCRSNYVDLATIHSDADMVKLQAEAQIHQFSGDAWFGVYKELHGWRWSYRNETLGTFIYWNPGQPDNYGNTEECVVVNAAGKWVDFPCAWPYHFLCYDERNSGTSRYIYISSTVLTWFEAQSYCRLYHTDLASSRDATEQSIIAGIIPYYTWFGLSRITWKWVDQTNPTNITWKPGQPDNKLALKDCGYLSNFQAANALCSNIKPFFCHEVITGQIQILRFNVQSDQNMNDPAVNAALLEKILQKLKEHGMEQNITLKWREQPGGDVFQKIKEADRVEIKKCEIKVF